MTSEDTFRDVGHDNIEVVGEGTTIRTEKTSSTNQSAKKDMLAVERILHVMFRILQEGDNEEQSALVS